jgi:formiminoglutamase
LSVDAADDANRDAADAANAAAGANTADAHANADWPTAAQWLASSSAPPTSGQPAPTDRAALTVAGVPLNEGAVTAGSRYDLASAAIRARLAKLSVLHGERGVLLPDVVDLGDDLRPPTLPDHPSALTVLLGGHNGVTYAALGGRDDLASWALLTLDAHHDVRPYAAGTVPGNGSPVRALIDAGLPGPHVVQVGIAGFSNSPAHRAWCDSAGITVLPPDRIGDVPRCLDELARVADHVYVDVDVDVLDRAFAPGCPGARPGGITPRQLFDAAFAAGAHPAVRAVDVVEVDPSVDVASITVDAAALCLLNVAAGFGTRQGQGTP